MWMSSRISDSRPLQWHDLQHEAWMNNHQQRRKQEQAGPSQRQRSLMDKVVANCSSCIVNRRTICKSVCDAELVLIYRPIGLWISDWLTPRLCGGPTSPSLSSDDGAEVDGATKTESLCATVAPTEAWKMKTGFFRYCAKRVFYSTGPANDHGNCFCLWDFTKQVFLSN